MTLVMVILISTVSFAATKENPTPGKNAEPEKTVFANETSELKAEALTGTLQDWMSNGSYWGKENSSEVSKSEFSNELSKWMSDGSYWSEPVGKKEAQESLTSKLKSYMTSGSYWKSKN